MAGCIPMHTPITVMEIICPMRLATLWPATATEPYCIIRLLATAPDTLAKIVEMLRGSPRLSTVQTTSFFSEISLGFAE